MEEKIIDIMFIIGVSVLGIYTVYFISPIITQGLEKVSEQIVTLPLPEEKEVTTKFIFFTLLGAISAQILLALIDVSDGHSVTQAFMASIHLIDLNSVTGNIETGTLKETMKLFQPTFDILIREHLPQIAHMQSDWCKEALSKCEIVVDKEQRRIYLKFASKFL